MIHWVVEQENRYHGAGGNFLNAARLSKLADKSEKPEDPRVKEFSNG